MMFDWKNKLSQVFTSENNLGLEKGLEIRLGHILNDSTLESGLLGPNLWNLMIPF